MDQKGPFILRNRCCNFLNMLDFRHHCTIHLKFDGAKPMIIYYLKWLDPLHGFYGNGSPLLSFDLFLYCVVLFVSFVCLEVGFVKF